MDIPYVPSAWTKRSKGDEILEMLHSLLFIQRAKVNIIKYNIFRFSGYDWSEHEEDERKKVEENLELACLQEENVAKTLGCLDLPHADHVEQEQKLSGKRKRKSTGKERPRRMRLKSGEPVKKGGRWKTQGKEGTDREDAKLDDEPLEEEEVEERKSNTFVDQRVDQDEDVDEHQQEEEQKGKKIAFDEEKADGDQTADRSDGNWTPDVSEESLTSSLEITNSSKPTDKVYTKRSRQKTKDFKEVALAGIRIAEDQATSKKGVTEKSASEWKVKERPVKMKVQVPSDEVLQNEVRDLLKDLSPADFTRVTLKDIVVQLEKKFNIDLSLKKAHVKLLIRQEGSRLATQEKDDGVDQNDMDVRQAAEEGVEAQPEGKREGEAGYKQEAVGNPEAQAEETAEAER